MQKLKHLLALALLAGSATLAQADEAAIVADVVTRLGDQAENVGTVGIAFLGIAAVAAVVMLGWKFLRAGK